VIKKILIPLLIVLGSALGSAFVAFNAWSWEVDVIAENQRGTEYQLIKNRKQDIESDLYDLETLRDREPEEFNERDGKRLKSLEKDLEVNDKRLDKYIEEDD